MGLSTILTKLKRRSVEPSLILPDTIRLTSSIASNTPELTSMQEQVVKGRPVDWYELLQNMDDYGTRDSQKPPRIQSITRDGACTVYTGHPNAELGLFEGNIEQTELITSGEGMSPHDVVLFSHGGGDKTLGVNGRGASLAYALLTQRGMTVEIESNFGGDKFIGTVSMVPVPGRPITHMVFDYKSIGRVWNERDKQTIIRIKRPDKQFIDSLSKASEIFLPANPKYARARLVHPDNDAVSPISETDVWEEGGKKVRVECLLDLSEPIDRKSKPHDSVYIGGLSVETFGYNAFPWAIWGGEHMKDSDKRVKRSIDSKKAEGRYDQAIVDALTHTKSNKLIDTWIQLNEDFVAKETSGGYNPTPFELGFDESYELSRDTGELLRAALLNKYGQLPFLCRSKNTFDYASKQISQPILQVPGNGFASVLAKIGCEDVIKHIDYNIREFKTDGSLPIRIPHKTMMIKQLAEIAGQGGIQIMHEKGRVTKILFTNPDLLRHFDADAYLALPEAQSVEEKLLSSISYLLDGGCSPVQIVVERGDQTVTHTFTGNRIERNSAHRGEYNISARTSIEKKHNREPRVLLLIDTSSSSVMNNYLVEDLPPEIRTAIAELKTEKPTDQMTRDEAAEEIARLRAQLNDVRKAEGKTKVITESIRRFIGGELDLKNLLQAVRTGESNGVAFGTTEEGLRLGVMHLGDYGREERFQIRTNGIGLNPAGYYREREGNELILATHGGIEWVDKNASFISLAGQGKKPSDWIIAPTLRLAKDTWTAIPIRIDMNDVTYVLQAGLEVEMDRPNKAVRARGVDAEVSFYQRRAKTSLFRERRPESIDNRVHCTMEDLEAPLASELIRIRDSSHSVREKAALILNLQEHRFEYNDDPDGERQIMERVQTVRDFERNLLNTATGTCNYAATSVALMLRLCHIPVKMEAGSVAGSKVSRRSDTHLWPIFWDGAEWVGIEGTRGSISPSVRIDFSGSRGGRMARLNGPTDLLSTLSSPSIWSKVMGGELNSEIRMALRALSESPEMMKELVQMLSTTDSKLAFETLIRGLMLTTAETVESGARAFALSQKEELAVLLSKKAEESD